VSHDESWFPWHLWLSETGSFLHGSAEVWRSPDCLQPLCAWRCRSHAKVFHPLENLDMSCQTCIYVYIYIHTHMYINICIYIHRYIYTVLISYTNNNERRWFSGQTHQPCQQTHFGAIATGHSCLAAISHSRPDPPKQRISWGFPITFCGFPNSERPKSLDFSSWTLTTHAAAMAIPSPHQVASVAVPGLPVSRSREIRPGFTMTLAQRQRRHSDGRWRRQGGSLKDPELRPLKWKRKPWSFPVSWA